MTFVRHLMVSLVAGAASLLADGGPEDAQSPIGAPAWKDRRPIGRIFLSSSGWRTTNNPSGYLNAKEDAITPEGRKRFREDLLAFADRCIANLQAMNAQGAVVWDLEGNEFPGMVYVGDPRKLPDFSPWMDEAADAFFAKFREAGLRTGLCIRPNYIFRIRPESVAKWGKWGYILYREPGIIPTNTNETWLATLKGSEKDPVVELSDRVNYARRRWKCSLFYIDTNNHAVNDKGIEKVVPMPASMFHRLAGLHPDVLLIPENTTPDYYATTAPYGQLDMHRMTTPEVRARFPGAFRLMSLDTDHPPVLWDHLVRGVQDGDVLFCEAGMNPGEAGGATVRAVYREAELRRSMTAQATPDSISTAKLEWVQGVTNAGVSADPLLKLAKEDPEWVVRRAALRPLALANRPEADGFLAGLVASPTNNLGPHAAVALGNAGARGLALLQPIMAASNDSLRQARYNVGYALSVYDGPECLTLIHALLRDKYSANRGLALALLKDKVKRFPDRATYEALLEARALPVNAGLAPRIDDLLQTLAPRVSTAERDGWNADTRARLPRMSKHPVMDGVFTPGEWEGAARFDAQVSQSENHLFLPRSVAWQIGWDATNLYLACRSPLAPNERVKRVARQSVGSTVMMDDSIELWLDPHGRNEGGHLASYFQAIVNALGITYYKQTYPKIMAINGTWNPGWRIASRVEPDFSAVNWEIAMPVAGFELAQPNKAGDTWGLMLARNFMYRAWDQSGLAWQFPNFGFSVYTGYPLFTLAENTPYVRADSPLPIMAGRAYAALDLVNPGLTPAELCVAFSISSKGGTNVFEKEASVTVPAGGTVPFRVDEAANPVIDPAVPAAYRYSLTVTTPAGAEVFHTHFPFNPTKPRFLLDRQLPAPPELAALATFNPVRRIAEAKVDVIDFSRRHDVTAARLVVKDAAGKTVGDQTSTLRFADMFTFWVPLPELAPGLYPWTASVILKDGTERIAGTNTLEKKDEAASFPWWNSPLGNADKVLWPYTALVQEKKGRILRAWGKEYELDGLALPQQIRITGNADKWPAGRSGLPEVLAAPMVCHAVMGGKDVPVVSRGAPGVKLAKAQVIELAGEGAAEGLAVQTATRLEQDGAYFVELTLAPGKRNQPVTVDLFELLIPVRSEAAQMLATYGVTGHGGGYVMKAVPPQPAGKPEEPVTIWESRENGSGVMAVGSFIPQVWLGSEFRGLLWYADNDQGWTPADGRAAQDLVRQADRVTMRFRFIDTPTVIDGPRTIRFVLQPTPIRPLQPGWRMLNVNFSQSFLPWDAMGRSSKSYNAMINLPNDAAYAKSAAFAGKWPGPQADPPNRAPYFAPHTESSAIMTTDWPARNYFGGEWAGGTYTDSLIDHTLWWVNKWIEKGGLQGLYHDQFAPHVVDSLSSGLAYVLPDGRIQPGYALTTRRRYVMRQHALFLERGILRPRILTHTTNGGPMGSCGWIESGMDGEANLINKAMGLDFADTWPSERLRAGSLSWNLGATYGWMRLIDEAGMTPAEKEHHRRVYAGHCLMHDTMNAWETSYASQNKPDSALLQWGMNDDRVFFWPFWRNGDVVKGQTETLKVSVWTLPDRILVGAFNYDKKTPAEAGLSLDLKKLGVALPPGSVAVDVEKADALVAWDEVKNECRFTVDRRDYRLISITAGEDGRARDREPARKK